MKKLLIANFKQNKNKLEIKNYFASNSFNTNEVCQVVIAPSFAHIDLVKELVVDVQVAGQTVSPFPKGAYTGAVGALQLKDLGATYCIVGHSERRKYFAESSQVVNNQIKELEAVGIIPIICFSDLDEVRQIETLKNDYYLSYEPIDSINTTGLNPNAYENKDIEATFAKVKDIIGDCCLIYGGSVDEENITRLCDVKGINGFLVGTASLDSNRFLELYRKVT
jgi:triosephosphate isomerase (TIM)